MSAPMTEKKIPSALPLYFAAAAFLALSAVLPVYRLWGLLAVCGGTFVVYAFAARKIPPRVVMVPVPRIAFATGEAGLDATLEQARADLDTLEQLNARIPDTALSNEILRMHTAGARILETVAAHPEKARHIRKFAAYYLPTAIRVLTNYANLAASGAAGDHAKALEQDVRANAAVVATAFEKQLDALFADEALDVSADLTVLSAMAAGDGLSDAAPAAPAKTAGPELKL